MRRALPVCWIAFALTGCGASRPLAPSSPTPTTGYAAFAHHGTHPVVDTREEAGVSLGLSADRASWALVRRYLEADRLPPAEAVRVEDCVAALAPGAAARSVTLSPSPLRAGWHTLLVTLPAPTRGAAHRPLVLSAGDGPIEAALSRRGLGRVWGELPELPAALAAQGQVVVITSGAGLGGLDAQGPLLEEVLAQRAAGRLVSVVERVAPGLDDALLDALAAAGGGLHEVAPETEAEADALAERLTRPIGWLGRTLTVDFDAGRVRRWRLIGHESRAARGDATARGGLVPAGEVVDVLFEVEPTGAAGPLGTLRLGSEAGALVAEAGGARHQAVVAAAAFCEKLRGSYWVKELAWGRLVAQIDALPQAGLARELGGLTRRAAALWKAEGGVERPVAAERALP